MKIALDYDETFTEDPILWTNFVASCKERGHSITFVTYRDSRYDNEDILYDADCLGIEVVFTGGKQKKHIFESDVWIDDNPVTICTAKEMGDMYDGCLINNDMGELSDEI